MLGSFTTDFYNTLVHPIDTVSGDLTAIDQTLITNPINAIWNSPTGSKILDQITPSQPALATVSPTLVQGMHVAPPTDEQLNQYSNDPQGLVDNLGQNAYSNYISNVSKDIQENAPDNSSTTTNIVKIAIVAAMAVLAVNLIKR